MCPTLRALIVLGLVLAACSSGDDDSDAGAELGSTSSIAPPSTAAIPSSSPAGTGVVVIGGTSSSFQVTTCELEPAVGGAAASELLHVSGEGTRANGVPFSLDVVRTATGDTEETFTDLITYTDTARILQVQRFEMDGEVSDLRDPDARGTLLRVRPDGVSAGGIAGPPGTAAPEGPGLVGLALDASC